MGVSWEVGWRVGHLRDLSWGFLVSRVGAYPHPLTPLKINQMFYEKRSVLVEELLRSNLRYFVEGSSPASAGDVLTCGDCRLVAIQRHHTHLIIST